MEGRWGRKGRRCVCDYYDVEKVGKTPAVFGQILRDF